MRIIKKLPALVLSVSAMLACDSRHDEGTAGTAGPRSDVEFIDTMIPHHQMALEMTDVVLQKGSGAEVKAMAQAMKDAQTVEIAEMRAIRTRLVGSAETTAHHDEHMAADMEKLVAASGTALDRLFLEEMLPHHAGAIIMAHEALPYLKESELQSMANKIVYDQAREIGDIATMLEK